MCRTLDSIVSEEPGRRLSELAHRRKKTDLCQQGWRGRPEDKVTMEYIRIVVKLWVQVKERKFLGLIYF